MENALCVYSTKAQLAGGVRSAQQAAHSTQHVANDTARVIVCAQLQLQLAWSAHDDKMPATDPEHTHTHLCSVSM